MNLPISTVFRIVKKCTPERVKSDNLFDFIKKSISKFCVLFQFLDLKQLSENRLEELCDIYEKSDQVGHQYFSYLSCNLSLIKEMIECRKCNQEQLKTTAKINEEMQKRLDDAESKNIEQQKNLKELELKIKQLQKQLKNSEEEKSDIKQENIQMQEKLQNSEKEKSQIKQENMQMQEKLQNSEEDKKALQKRLEEEESPIKGKVSASVKNGLLISAQIDLAVFGASIDTSRSKYIICASFTKTVGREAYERGEPITSLQVSTVDFLCKSGTYCVRCLVFDSQGRSRELVSNSVTTSGTSVAFAYEGRPAKVSLCKGKYKLEVWGAKGGDSGGTRKESKPPGQGGLGGYSSGILTLDQCETVHVLVGGEGRTANSSEGATTEGGFPDGGGTVTRHWDSYTSVPGTEGGSTSVRVGGDTDLSRVIVAGGGGGASGDYGYTDHGGFGGGLSGGNCYKTGESYRQGSGTQTGSTGGVGAYQNGDPGSFGHGATGNCYTDRNSGGGGGGGWYGGGGGGCGNGRGACSSGGGGSGWIFTEPSFSTWQSGDPSNSSRFLLNNSFYLTDATSSTGDEEFPQPDGNGTERGHAGNGYAKITPQ